MVRGCVLLQRVYARLAASGPRLAAVGSHESDTLDPGAEVKRKWTGGDVTQTPSDCDDERRLATSHAV